MTEDEKALIHEQLEELKSRMERMEKSIDGLICVMLQARGIWTFIKVIIYIGTPITAMMLWFREHIK